MRSCVTTWNTATAPYTRSLCRSSARPAAVGAAPCTREAGGAVLAVGVLRAAGAGVPAVAVALLFASMMFRYVQCCKLLLTALVCAWRNRKSVVVCCATGVPVVQPTRRSPKLRPWESLGHAIKRYVWHPTVGLDTGSGQTNADFRAHVICAVHTATQLCSSRERRRDGRYSFGQP